VLCILPSVSVPLVLRTREDIRYNLVGACYIHGIMNGELVEEFGKDKLQEGILMLCKISY
jgi:hypothetical protein